MTTVTIFVDVGAEIDDEQLLYYIETTQQVNNPGWIITVVFCGFGATSDIDSLVRWTQSFKLPNKQESLVLTRFREKPDPKMVPLPITSDGCLTYTLLEEYVSRPNCVTDYALLCASVKGWDAENFFVREAAFFQGNLEDVKNAAGVVVSPKGLNASGTEKLITRLTATLGDRFVVCSSDRCVEMRPTAGYLQSLPTHFAMETAEAGFKLMVGRIRPGIVLPTGIELSKKLAAGLVNANRGRGANFDAMVAFMDLLNVSLTADFCPPSLTSAAGRYYNSQKYTQASDLARNYFAKVYENSELPGVVSYMDMVDGILQPVEYDWDRDTSLLNLTLIHLGLDSICPGVWDNKALPFFSTFTLQTPDASLQRLRELYLAELTKLEGNRQIGFLLPTYDLFTGFVFHMYVSNKWKKAVTEATPQEFFNAVSIGVG